MRYSAELAARARTWLARDIHSTGPQGKRSAEGLLELATVWAAIQNLPLPRCLRQCDYTERVRDLSAYVREYQQLLFTSPSAAMSDTQTPSKYQIAPAYAGQSFVHEDYNGVLTADNLTDEGAEFFISKGRGDAFVLRDGSAAAAVTASDTTTDVEPTNPLVPEADLTAEQEAHAQTRQRLADTISSYTASYAGVTTELTEKTAALASEKQAHETTKAQLSEVQAQVATLTDEVADLTQQLATAKAKKPKGTDAPVQ